MGRHVLKVKLALPFLGAALTQREQVAEAAIGCAIGWINKQARGVFKVEARADDELYPHLLGGEMGAYHAGKAVVIGDGDGFELEPGSQATAWVDVLNPDDAETVVSYRPTELGAHAAITTKPFGAGRVARTRDARTSAAAANSSTSRNRPMSIARKKCAQR